VGQEARFVKNGLIVVFLVVACLSPLAFTTGVAAQNPVERTEPQAGAMLGKAPANIGVWLEEPLSTEAGAELRVVHNESGKHVDVGSAALDPNEPTHLEVQLRRDLGHGKCVVSWVVASGGHEAKGTFSFTVADQAKEENNNLVTIALATFGVAGAATVVGLLGYLLRVRLGLVKPPPPPDEVHGPH
jgi:methionine-rich copper-binding protein CopC